MLILRRKAGQSIIIGGDIRIEVAEIAGNQVKLVIDAPREVPVHRQEVWEAIRQEMLEAARPADFTGSGEVPEFPSRPDEDAGSGLIVEEDSGEEDPGNSSSDDTGEEDPGNSGSNDTGEDA